MGSVTNGCSSPVFPSPLNFLENKAFFHKKSFCNLIISNKSSGRNGIFCKISGTGVGEDPGKTSKSRTEDYNTAMKNMMRSPYEYHHDLGMNYTLITDKLIVGSQPQKREDIDHLKQEENVAYILNLQQDKDIEYWGIDFQSILKRCKELGIRHMRRPARDFDPNSLRNGLPKAVSSLEWAISEGKGRIYVHCTAGLGRAPAVAIAYLFWFFNMDWQLLPLAASVFVNPSVVILTGNPDGWRRLWVHILSSGEAARYCPMLNTAYNKLTKKRPCGPNKRAIRGATYDLATNDPWKEPFESLPEYAFENVADWERKLIQDRVRALRGT